MIGPQGTPNYMAYHYTSRCRDPKDSWWGALGVDYVFESTGGFLIKEMAQSIINYGSKKVI